MPANPAAQVVAQVPSGFENFVESVHNKQVVAVEVHSLQSPLHAVQILWLRWVIVVGAPVAAKVWESINFPAPQSITHVFDVESRAYPGLHILHFVLSVSFHKAHPVADQVAHFFFVLLLGSVINESPFFLSQAVHTPEASQADHPNGSHIVQTPFFI